jgi:glycosyltransferase involved in cell wall biosynthesis
MKIGIEGQRLFRQKKHGMDFVALELVKNLMEMDKTNSYFVFVAPGPDKCLHDTSNFRIIELNGGSYPRWEQIALPKAAKDYGCELLHCTSNTGPIFSSVPVVVTVHDIFYLETISLFRKGFTPYQKFGNMYRRYVVPAVVKRAKKIITVSHSEKRRIANYFKMFDERLTVVYNGVSTRFFPVTDKATLTTIKETYSLPDRFIFLLGNTDPKKNTRGVILAYAGFLKQSIEQMKLVVADFPEASLLTILSEEGLQDIRPNIIRLDYIRNPDLPAIFTLCSQFLYPSFWESFGIPILEGMACGAPVITSNVFAMPEIAGDAALLINPKDVGEMTNAMLRLSTDDTLVSELRSKGQSQAKRFSWRKMAEDYLTIYNEIIQK